MQIKKTFKKICYEESAFNTFLFEPKDRIYGIVQLEGLTTKPFDEDSIPQTIFEPENFNDISTYDKYYNFLIKNENYEETRNYFYQCFSHSEIIERIPLKIKINDNFERTEYCDFRKAHDYFKNKLLNTKIPINEKISIIKLFIGCKNGYPNTLFNILINTYEQNKSIQDLNLNYIYAFGELVRERDSDLFELLKRNFNSRDFYISYHSLLSIFKIDVKSRILQYNPNVSSEPTTFSNFIKDTLTKHQNTFLKIACSLGFTSELYFNNELSIFFKGLDKYYIEFFKTIFTKSLKEFFKPYIKKDVDKIETKKIVNYFKLCRFTTLIGQIGDFLNKKKKKKEAENFYLLMIEGIIKFAQTENSEIQNLAVIFHKIGKIEKGIEIAQFLVNKNPNNIGYYKFLLNMYLVNKKYEKEFEKTKKNVLENFKLTEEQKKDIEKYNY